VKSLDTPYFIIENEENSADEFLKENSSNFIKIDLSKSGSDMELELLSYIQKQIKNKFNIKNDFDNYLAISLFKDIQEELGQLDIIYTNFDKLTSLQKYYVCSYIRICYVIGDGKLLHHLSTQYEYMELWEKDNTVYHTWCADEKILLGHEIQYLIYNKNIYEKTYNRIRKSFN